MRPTEDYLPHFQPTLLKARLAANTAATLACIPDGPLSDAMPALLSGDYVIDDMAPQVQQPVDTLPSLPAAFQYVIFMEKPGQKLSCCPSILV